MATPSLRRNREYMLLWSGQTLSELGSQLSLVAYPLLVLALTGSPAKAGVVGFAKTLPFAVLALPAGALVDRFDRRRVMVATDAFRALALLSIPIALAAGTVPYGLIVAVAFIDGSGFVISYIAERGALRQLVPRAQLRDAVAQNESRTFAAMLAGPPLGGVLFQLGRAVPFLADAVSYAASTTTMLLIRTRFQERRVDGERAGLGEGLRWIWRERFFRACALLAAGGNPVFTALYLLIVIIAKRHGASAALVGVMLGIVAGGGLLGALLAPALGRRLQPRQAVLLETALMTAVIPLLLVAHNALLLGLIVAACECVTPVVNAMVVGRRVALAPDRLQGRVQAASTLVAFSAGWAGPLFVGLAVENAGTTVAVVTLAGWMLGLATAAALSPGLRQPPTEPDAAPVQAGQVPRAGFVASSERASSV